MILIFLPFDSTSEIQTSFFSTFFLYNFPLFLIIFVLISSRIFKTPYQWTGLSFRCQPISSLAACNSRWMMKNIWHLCRSDTKSIVIYAINLTVCLLALTCKILHPNKGRVGQLYDRDQINLFAFLLGFSFFNIVNKLLFISYQPYRRNCNETRYITISK